MRTLLLEEMTWPEIKEALDNGMRTVIIYAASIEQHGPHLAEATDTILGYAGALDIAKRLGNALVAPVIRPGLSAHHMSLPGTITLRPEVFIGLVEDYVSAYVRHGFDTIILSSSHGGNFNTMEKIAEQESKKYPDVKIISGFSLDTMMRVLGQVEAEEGLEKGACGGHSCAWETSAMIKSAPNCVQMDKAERGFVGNASKEALDQLFAKGIVSLSETGILGDATPATEKLGETFFKALQDAQENVIREKLSNKQ